MSFEDNDRSGLYDDSSTYPQQDPAQEYYRQRRCTPMGRPRRSKKHNNVVAIILIVLLLGCTALGVARMAQALDIHLERGAHGFYLSVQPKGLRQETQAQSGDTEAQPEAEAPSETPAEADTPSEDDPVQAADEDETQKAAEVLNVQPPQQGAETVVSEEKDALSLQEIYQKMNPSVVSIVSTLRSGTATGTGIIMSENGYIITNHHVIEGAYQLAVLTYDDTQYTAELIGSDAISDLAVLKIEAEGLTAAEFGDSDALRVGDSVVAIGDPLGIQLRGTMTNGIVSAINRDLTVEDRKMTLVQTNAALNNGNSGGPLINCYGQVIGINTMKMSSYYSSASVEGLGFAIPVSVAKPIIDELIENGYVAGRPAIGLNGESMPEYARLYYRLPKGIYITYVSETSDAYLKGIRQNDILTAVNGTAVSTIDELNTIKNQYSAGDQLTLTIYRDGHYYDVDVTLMDQALQ
ncbi:MAG: S1C family serine protease [Firmicutes bacterium]|nr:S1C family serine protease [Bacillota bacterium]MDY2808625.1 S1C family serine protease [Oscillospiraceae bacterium]